MTTTSVLYKSAIRTVVTIFGSLFNNIYVRTYNIDGSISETTRKVNISFSDKSNYAIWIESKMRRPDNNTKIGLRLPRLSYDLTGFSPNEQRQLNPHMYSVGAINQNTTVPFANKANSPASYEFNFTLTLWASDMDTSVQVLENILPYFKPEVNIKVIEQDELSIANDISVVFRGITKNDNYQDGFEQNRIIQWDMDFSVFSNIWTKSEASEIIKEIKIDLSDDFISLSKEINDES